MQFVFNFVCLFGFVLAVNSQTIKWMVTTENKKQLLSLQNASLSFADISTLPTASLKIKLNTSTKYQTILGIGSSLESSTAYNLNQLEQDQRTDVIKKLFSVSEGNGFNLMRLTIGTSDYCPAPYYSYDDLPAGETDVELTHFSTARDEEFIIPAIQAAIKESQSSITSDNSDIHDELLFFASPWSGPGWMKSNQGLIGGHLLDEYMKAYADYLVKFVTTYSSLYDIKIHAITPQNEPLANQTYPSTLFPAEQAVKLIDRYLGPSLAKINCELWCFDHNWNTLFYPARVLNDTRASKYVQGTGFHGYRGQPKDMSTLHEKFPDKDIYFTERSSYGIKGATEVVAIFRNWARSYNAWVTMLDTNLQPNSGPFKSNPTMVQLNVSSTPYSVIYNLEYFIYGHFSRYIRRGAVRISSEDDPTAVSTVSHVAFTNDATSSGIGTTVLILVNNGSEEADVQVCLDGTLGATVLLPAHSISTLIW